MANILPCFKKKKNRKPIYDIVRERGIYFARQEKTSMKIGTKSSIVNTKLGLVWKSKIASDASKSFKLVQQWMVRRAELADLPCH
jgi:hypothetical protein